MAIIDIRRTVSLDGAIMPEALQGMLYGGEDQAHRFIISATKDGQAHALSGTVSAVFVREADMVEVPVTGGSISNGNAQITLGEHCYYRPGRFVLSIFVTADGSKTMVYQCRGNVARTDGNTVVDPDGEITLTVADLIADIEAATASIPSDYSSLLATIADAFSSSAAYSVGQRVWYDGTLYQFITPHAAGSWTGQDIRAVVIASDMTAIERNAAIAPEIIQRSALARWKLLGLGTLTSSKIASTANSRHDISIVDGSSAYGYYRISVKPNTLYKIIGYNYYDTFCYIVTDANGVVLNITPHAVNEDKYVPYAEVILTPETATYMYLNICTTTRSVYGSTYTADNRRPIVAEEADEDEAITLTDLWNQYSTDLPLRMTASSTEYYQSKIIPVHAGDKYFIRSHTYYDLIGYAYVANDGTLMAKPAQGSTSVTWSLAAIDIQRDGFMIISTATGWDDIYWARAIDQSCFGKKWYVIGDSFSAFLTGRGAAKDINYVDLVAGALGLNVQNEAVSDTGYGKGSSNTFLDKASGCAGFDLVTVFGSLNDLATNLPLGDVTDIGTTTMAGRMYNTINTIRETEPEATVVVIAPAPWITQNSVNGNEWGTIHPNAYVNMLRSICLRYNVPYVDLYYEGGAHPWDWGTSSDPDLTYLYDSTHYNTDGHAKFIAPMVIDGILRAMR